MSPHRAVVKHLPAGTCLGAGAFGSVHIKHVGGVQVRMQVSLRSILLKLIVDIAQMAVKRVDGAVRSSTRAYARREAALLQRLRHDNIVAFHQFEEHQTFSLLSMEYCAAGDLHSFIHDVP